MTLLDECTHCDHLLAVIESAHERAVSALTGGGEPLFDAVAWLSAHLAAMERVVEPELRRHVTRTGAQRRADRKARNELVRLVRMLEQLAAADALAPYATVAQVRDRVVSLLSEHAEAERHFVDQLARALGAQRAVAVATRYERAVAHGPTRPHPHAPHGRLMARPAFAVNRARDRILNVLDSRHVPIPAPRRAMPPTGKWGDYLLGSMHVADDAGPDAR